ncbi:hypothetical protein O181_103733, partial [Austropuccinia psidii MF-1]|nr:hypothetical protein [Austropuccinia psidii MF-1]
MLVQVPGPFHTNHYACPGSHPLCHNAVCQTSAKGTLAEKAIKPVERPINTGK